MVEHLAVLRQEVAAEGGAVVKALGDAIMAVFPRPVCAVLAMLSAQRAVAGKPLELKVGIHAGRCVAVNQNGVLDYFGSTVNLAARLVELSSGGDDLIVSDAVLEDTEVVAPRSLYYEGQKLRLRLVCDVAEQEVGCDRERVEVRVELGASRAASAPAPCRSAPARPGAARRGGSRSR